MQTCRLGGSIEIRRIGMRCRLDLSTKDTNIVMSAVAVDRGYVSHDGHGFALPRLS